ncbi:MAG: sulfite exporter TauE/SafE family protein [Sulfuricella sp.]
MLDALMPNSAPLVLPQPIGYFAAWGLGLTMGLTACTVSCLPFMGTWVLGRGDNGRGAVRDTGLFLLGRIAAYSLLGALAGTLGGWLAQALESGIGHAAIGLASIAAGAWLLLPERRRSCGAMKRAATMPPLLLGFSLSLTPCAPLGALLAACAVSGGGVQGMGYGLSFGLGAALTPLLLLLPLLALFGDMLRENRPWLVKWTRYGAAAVLVAVGVRRLMMV